MSVKSSASSTVSTGPVDWKNNPQYYAFLEKLRQKDNPDSWKDNLETMKDKFPGVNFTVDGIQAYYKKQQEHAKIAEKAVSESLSDNDSASSSSSSGGGKNKVASQNVVKKSVTSADDDAKNELVRATLKAEILKLTQDINKLELERKKKEDALALHNANVN